MTEVVIKMDVMIRKCVVEFNIKIVILLVVMTAYNSYLVPTHVPEVEFRMCNLYICVIQLRVFKHTYLCSKWAGVENG